MPGLWERLRGGLTRTRQGLGDRIRGVFADRQWSDDLWETLEEILYEADLGVDTVNFLLEQTRAEVRNQRPREATAVVEMLKRHMMELVRVSGDPRSLTADRPTVWMVVGVNGTGKTTTVGKMAYQMRVQGFDVILGAADTFRAAAQEQLSVWASRAGVEMIGQDYGADAAAVAFDTIRAASARHADLVIIDTAGRLHNKAQLMQELAKVHRVTGRALAGAPHQVWLVLDATTGQNGLLQAQVFLETVQVTGIVLTKLDGTAKGGVALSVSRQLHIPVRWVGVGENLDDLMPFDPEAYVEAIIGRPS